MQYFPYTLTMHVMILWSAIIAVIISRDRKDIKDLVVQPEHAEKQWVLVIFVGQFQGAVCSDLFSMCYTSCLFICCLTHCNNQLSFYFWYGSNRPGLMSSFHLWSTFKSWRTAHSGVNSLHLLPKKFLRRDDYDDTASTIRIGVLNAHFPVETGAHAVCQWALCADLWHICVWSW